MRIGVLLAGYGLLVVGCGGSTSTTGAGGGASLNDTVDQAGSSSSDRHWPASLDDGGPGACGVARAYVSCTGENGGCACLSDDPTTCTACAAQFPGPLSCVSQCAANEYAVSCGGPPQPSTGVTYQDVPAGCHSVGATPGGNQYACCPFE